MTDEIYIVATDERTRQRVRTLLFFVAAMSPGARLQDAEFDVAWLLQSIDLIYIARDQRGVTRATITDKGRELVRNALDRCQ